MSDYNTFEQVARELGISSYKHPLRQWIDKKNGVLPVSDAELATTPNSTVPAAFTSYLSTEVVNILTAPRVATQIFPEVKEGDWTTSYYEYEVREFVGETQPYADYADAGMSDVNRNWVPREQYLFQTNVSIGIREAAISGATALNLIAAKQESAANTIAMDMNKFQMLGVAKKGLYGILNDPNRPAAYAAMPGAGGGTTWASKTMLEIYNDIIRMFGTLASNSMGLITENDEVVLLMSPKISVQLASATDFNTSVLDLAKRYLPRLRTINVPELSSDTAGETIMMIAPTVAGQQTGRLPISERYRAGEMIPALSSVSQKVWAGTYGAEIRIGVGIATMTDV